MCTIFARQRLLRESKREKRARGEPKPVNFAFGSNPLASFQALSGRLKFTVRRHKFNKDYLFWSGKEPGRTKSVSPSRVRPAGTNILSRCRAKLAHKIQSRPASGLGFQVQVLKTFKLFALRSEADLEGIREVRKAGREERGEPTDKISQQPKG